MVNFKKARELFRDVVEIDNYVPLFTLEKIQSDLLNAIDKKEKMIFLTGEAGSGKSMILKRIFEELKNNEKVFFISNPYLQISSILNILKQLSLKEHHLFLIDEAQLLREEIFEELRIYADRGNVTLVFATHETDLKRLLAKKHFFTRINYIFTLNRVSLKELEKFIKIKLLKHNLLDIAEMIKKSNYKLIYKYTKGSLRTTNQLMFKVFDILDFFCTKYPNKVDLNKLSNKYIDMAYLDLKEKNA